MSQDSIIKIIDDRIRQAERQMAEDAVHFMFFHSGSTTDLDCDIPECQLRDCKRTAEFDAMMQDVYRNMKINKS